MNSAMKGLAMRDRSRLTSAVFIVFTSLKFLLAHSHHVRMLQWATASSPGLNIGVATGGSVGLVGYAITTRILYVSNMYPGYYKYPIYILWLETPSI